VGERAERDATTPAKPQFRALERRQKLARSKQLITGQSITSGNGDVHPPSIDECHIKFGKGHFSEGMESDRDPASSIQ